MECNIVHYGKWHPLIYDEQNCQWIGCDAWIVHIVQLIRGQKMKHLVPV